MRREAQKAPTPPAQRRNGASAVCARVWELGIEFTDVVVTCTAGCIAQADLDAHVACGASAPRPAPRAASSGAISEVRIVGLRCKIAQRMQESKRRIPHFSYVE